MKEINLSPKTDLLALLSAQIDRTVGKGEEGTSLFETLFGEALKQGETVQNGLGSSSHSVEPKEEEPPLLLNGGEEIESSLLVKPADVLFTAWLISDTPKKTEGAVLSPNTQGLSDLKETKGTVVLQEQSPSNGESDSSLADRDRPLSKQNAKNESPQETAKSPDALATSSLIKGTETGATASVQNTTYQIDAKPINSAQPFRETIMTTLRKEMSAEFSSVFKTVQADKIVIQLKPLELGMVEVTVEQIDGEYTFKLKSENKDVQELLDGMAEEIQDEWKSRDVKGIDEKTDEQEREGKTKEEWIDSEKRHEEEAKDTSFEDMLTEWIGGQSNGWNLRYYQ